MSRDILGFLLIALIASNVVFAISGSSFAALHWFLAGFYTFMWLDICRS